MIRGNARETGSRLLGFRELLALSRLVRCSVWSAVAMPWSPVRPDPPDHRFRLIIVSSAEKAAQVARATEERCRLLEARTGRIARSVRFSRWPDRSDRTVRASRGSAGGIAHVACRRSERRVAASNRLRDRAASGVLLIRLAHSRQRSPGGFIGQQRQVHAQRRWLLRSGDRAELISRSPRTGIRARA